MTPIGQTMRAVRTTGDAEAPVTVGEAPRPVPASGETLVRVHAISLNAGEIRRARRQSAGERIGWDFAGTVESENSGTSRLAGGTRVVGFVAGGAWADYVAAPTAQLGVLPDNVSFEDAATLPVAGLTALRALRHGGDVRAKSVLVVPGTGGVGLFALQLASAAGAAVSTVIRSATNEALVRTHGAANVMIGSTAEAGRDARYDLILESLGGESLGTALGMLRPGGTVVSFGQTAGASATFAADVFYATGGASLYGFYLFYESEREPAGNDLEYLAGLVAAGKLATNIDATLPFEHFAAAVSARAERKLAGKIVVSVD